MSMAAPSRNQPCPCGSGKKFKHCCANRTATQAATPTPIKADNGSSLTLPQAIQLAIQHHQAGRLRKAVAIYQQILQVQPDHADALHLSGLVNHQLGQHDLAYTLIDQAIALNPRAAQFHNNLGEVCRALNRPDEALACYAKAVTLQPDFPEAHRNIGLVHLANGEPDRAVSCLHDAMARFPDYLGVYWALGQALMSQHKADEAIGIYDRGLAKNPSDSALLCAKGIALKAAGRLEDAIRHYRHAIELQPHAPELHHNLALLYMQQGNTEEALAHLEKEVGLDPHAESAQHLLAALRNTTTDRAPVAYVRETFDGYADGFDQHLVNKLGYRVPEHLAQALRDTLGPDPQTLAVLDLGCGTGLFGEAIGALRRNLVGVDLSPRMIEKARQRQIYDELIVGDVLDYLAEAENGRFDLIAAVDVFIYVGNLLPVFEHASRILAPGGWLAVSIEAAPPESGDFSLAATGRYQHRQDYLARLGAEFGFTTAHVSESCLRKEKDKTVPGFLYLLKKV
jgi:predicted TPR repeat methyltransferase